MANVTISNGSLVVTMSSWQALLALQTSFSIALTQVRGATEDSHYIASGMGIRSPGTGFPGLVAQGTFRKDGQRVLSLWRRGQQIAVIELSGAKWDRILLGCEDAKTVAQQINRAIVS